VPLYDGSKPHRSGSTIHVKLLLRDANGVNLSSDGVVLTALGTAPWPVSVPDRSSEDSGASNPGGRFRFTALDGHAELCL
jgi:hypothetical protein